MGKILFILCTISFISLQAVVMQEGEFTKEKAELAKLKKDLDAFYKDKENEYKKASKRKDLNTLISGARMDVEAVLAETQLSILELLNLKKDDVILFNKNATSSSAKVYINKKEKFAAIAGLSNNRKAVQIESNIDHEKMETLEKLRVLREEREARQKEQNERIARLIETKNEYI